MNLHVHTGIDSLPQNDEGQKGIRKLGLQLHVHVYSDMKCVEGKDMYRQRWYLSGKQVKCQL